MRRTARVVALAALFLLPAPLAAQAGGGISVGTVKLANGATQRDLNGIVGIQPKEWLTITATVSAVHIATTYAGTPVTSDGLGDLPISVGATRALPGPRDAELGATLDLVLPTGDATAGLGTGSFTMSGGVGAAVNPTTRLRVAVAASRLLTGEGGTSALTPTRATALALEGELALAPRWAGTLSVEADVGPADSALALDRSLGLGARYQLHGPVSLTLDASHGLSASAPKWALVVGIGTTLGGNNPAGGELSSRRIAKSLSAGAGRGNGSGKVGHGRP